MREAETLSKLDNPSIIKIYNYFFKNEQRMKNEILEEYWSFYILMEYA